MWDLTRLVELCHEAGYKIAVETQASMWRDWLRNVDQLTLSPKGPGMQERFDEKRFRSFLEKIGPNTKTCVKIVCFGQADIEFAVDVNAILDHVTKDVRQSYLADSKLVPIVDEESRYLSLGNYMQPVLGEDLQLHDQVDEDAIAEIDQGDKFPYKDAGGQKIQYELLDSYRNILEMDFLPDPRLANWKFLPQLHVLVWANKAKV